ncbi:hypothetical protein N431DRAFT_196665 [Stipitochalara longipes BDJ]|nr:hypothetical protein N431DRAFT_196665 [Stipitochalara longipes BDJ]
MESSGCLMNSSCKNSGLSNVLACSLRSGRILKKKTSSLVLVLSQLDTRYYTGLEGLCTFGLSFSLRKRGDPNSIISCKKNIFMERSVSVDLNLDAGEYLVFLKIEARRNGLQSVEEVVRANIQNRRAELLQVALNHDLAHSKVRYEVEIEEKAARKRAKRQKLSKLKKVVKKKLTKDKMRMKHIQNKEKRKKRAAKAKKLAKAKAKTTKEVEEKAKLAPEGDRVDAACQTLKPPRRSQRKIPAPQIEPSAPADPVVYPTLQKSLAEPSITITIPADDEDDDDDSDLDSIISDVSSGEIEEYIAAIEQEQALMNRICPQHSLNLLKKVMTLNQAIGILLWWWDYGRTLRRAGSRSRS